MNIEIRLLRYGYKYLVTDIQYREIIEIDACRVCHITHRALGCVVGRFYPLRAILCMQHNKTYVMTHHWSTHCSSEHNSTLLKCHCIVRIRYEVWRGYSPKYLFSDSFIIMYISLLDIFFMIIIYVQHHVFIFNARYLKKMLLQYISTPSKISYPFIFLQF